MDITFKEFLKKYSTINNEFIDDFYNIYEHNEEDFADFIVSLDLVCKWLGVHKNKSKATLVNTYHQNIDYKVNKITQTKGSGGHNKEIIMLTPDCFKRLCLLSKSPKAEIVRSYFLEMEKMLFKYKNYVIDALEKNIIFVTIIKNHYPILKWCSIHYFISERYQWYLSIRNNQRYKEKISKL